MARTSGTRLQAVGEEEIPTLIGEEEPAPRIIAAPVSRETSPRAQTALTGLLLTSLRALSQRTIVAIASLVDLALVASAFALWLMVIANPTPLQLGGVGGYAAFILFALYMRRD